MTFHSLVGLAIIFASFPVCSASGQGPLTPPGAPSRTMKTLQQVEPRTELATLPGDATDVIVISTPGSYYLSADLIGAAGVNGILINADNVSIDLNGFAVIGPASGPNTFSGIVDSSGHRNLSISNGTIRGWGLGNISLINSFNVELRQLRLSDCVGNGSFAAGDGFNGRSCSSALIVDCLATGNAGDGFACGVNATLNGCISSHNALSGYSGSNCGFMNCGADSNASAGWFIFSGGRLSHCTSSGIRPQNTQGEGFYVGSGSVLTGCLAFGNSDAGFYMGSGCAVTGCVAKDNAVNGYTFGSNNLLTNNLSTGNNGDGFQGSGSNNRVDSNSAIGNTLSGFRAASSSADFVLRNTAFANGTNYIPMSGPYSGPFGLPSTSTSPWANF